MSELRRPSPGHGTWAGASATSTKAASRLAFYQRFTGNLQVMMGTGFLVAGFALGAALWQTGGYALVIPTLALLGGLATLIPGMRHANGKLRAVR